MKQHPQIGQMTIKPLIFILIASLFSVPAPENPEWTDCILLSEQSEHRVAVWNVKEQKIVWEWVPARVLKPEHAKWFTNMSDAKLVYDGKFILATASGGGVALVRISDARTVFYTFVGGNTHSAEVLPDGNLVSASSTGNYLTIIRTDTTADPENVYRKNITLDFAHNVVWDRENNLLWSAGRQVLHSHAYNFDCKNPDLVIKDSYEFPGTEGHDLFPVQGSNSLWLTNTTHVYRFDINSRKLSIADDVTLQEHVKSVSSGVGKYPTIVIQPKVSWWTDEVLDGKGRRVFIMPGLKIYKARWMVPVPFSYAKSHPFNTCS